jgi:hypothetical protein
MDWSVPALATGASFEDGVPLTSADGPLSPPAFAAVTT